MPVGARALSVLEVLVAARGDLVTKDELLRKAWPGLVVEEANVQVQVWALRKILGADAITTVPSLGYRLALPVMEGSGGRPRHNLAAERTAFIGRVAMLADAQSRLTQGPLLSLIGIGGSGKTRLARRLAEQQLNQFAGGVWWVDLAPLDRAEQLATAVAQALGCRLDGAASTLEALILHLRSQQTFLVLDNCEHLLEAVCSLLDSLLEAAPGLRVVATSREALGLRGETILPVKPLELPPPGASPEQVWSSEAARLFLQSAQLACPQLPLGDETAATVAAICRQLDGIPLALELAASQLRILAPEQLLDVLQQRFRLLLGARRSLPRQQTLHAVIRWSVDNLGDPEREVLVALAACAGGCDLAAVQALVAQGSSSEVAMTSLARMSDRALIAVQHTAGKARYLLLETVRQFVLETLLTEENEAALQDRHRIHYLEIAESLRPQLAQAARVRALVQLDLERDNMARAIDWAVRRRQWLHGARFVHALLPHWTARMWLIPGLELAQAVLAVATPEEDRLLASTLMIDAAKLAHRMGRLDLARALALDALRQAQQQSSLEHEIDALVVRAYCALDEGNEGAAAIVPDIEVMLERAVRGGLIVSQSQLLGVLAQARMSLGELEEASKALVRSRRAHEVVGNPTGVLLQTIHLAWVAVRRRDATQARQFLKEVAQQQQLLDHDLYACLTLFTIAALAGLEGRWARCLRAHQAALRHMEAGGVADSPMRRRQREDDLARAREALDPDARATAEAEAVTTALHDDLAWAIEGL